MTRKTLTWLAAAAAAAALIALGTTLGGGGAADAPAAAGADTTAAAAAKPTIWTCSMHPQIRLPEPGKCPICFMDLIPLEDADADDAGPRTLVMSERAAALAEVRTAPVVRGAARTRVRMVGTVAYDETRVRRITAWVPGRLDTLFVDFTGTEVARGERLASLYSPELYAAQAELLNAVEAARATSRSASALVRDTSAGTVDAARRRLARWGLTDTQIAAIEARGEARDHVDITAPIGGVVVHKDALEGMYVQTGTPLYTVADLSRVWVEMEAYESDLPWLDVGQEVAISVAALPGRTLTGRVVFIDPVLDPRRRTARVRVDVPNPDGRIKPGMYADGVVEAAPTADAGALLIPATAPLITGTRAVVYVQEPAAERPTFMGRVVELGPRAGDSYVVAAGLDEGELVVVHGAFKIDSALQIQAKPSMMNPAPESATAPVARPAAPAEPLTVPAAFTAQLDAVLDAYLAAQGSLAADDDDAAGRAAADLADALAAVDMELLDGPAHAEWMRLAAPLRKAAAAFAAADGIAARRDALRPLSDALWAALDRLGSGREEVVRRFHCPMADDNRGADWLQLATTTENPYFGASMLRCGSQVDSLVTDRPQER